MQQRRETLSRPNPNNRKMLARYCQQNAVSLKLGVDIEYGSRSLSGFNSGGSIAIALNHGYRIVTHILRKR